MKNNVGDEQFDVEFREYQDRATQALYQLVEYLREQMKKRTKDFVLFELDEIAKNSDMDEGLKKNIIFALENPDKEFVVKFQTKGK